MGYGYYGMPRNWVTLYSFDTLQRSLEEILKNAVLVDQRIEKMMCTAASSMQNVANYSNTISDAKGLQTQIQQNIIQYNNSAIDLLTVIKNLEDAIAAQKIVVDADQAAFNQAVLDASAGPGPCGFKQALAVATAVVAVVSAVYTAGASLVAAYAAVGTLVTTGITSVSVGASAFDQLKNAYEQVKPIVSKIETADANLEAIGQKYQQLETLLRQNPNSARVAVQQDGYDTLSAQKLADFDRTVDGAPVNDSIKASFKQAVHRYVELIQTHNKKIYEHDAFIVRIQEAARDYCERELEIGQVATIQAKYVNNNVLPDQVEYLDTLQRIRTAQLNLMRRLVGREAGPGLLGN